MEWIRVEIKTTQCGAEIITGLLLSCNIIGAEIADKRGCALHLAETANAWDYADEGLLSAQGDDVFVIFYVTMDAAGEVILAAVREGLGRLKEGERDCSEGFSGDSIIGLDVGSLEMQTLSADDKTWLDEWKKHFKPFRAGKVLIVPEWERLLPREVLPDDIVFTIDPGSAFGTGQHETTRLCLSALQEFLRGGDTMLDIGCGSGILSIVGLLLGAGEVFACDIDPAGAIAATKKNANLNPVDISRLQIRAGDVLSDNKLRAEICQRNYNIVVANIVADVVIALVPFVREILSEGGVFIASGIIDDRAGEVLDIFAKNNMRIMQETQLGGWFCFVGGRA